MRFNAKCKMQNAKLRKFKICNLKFAICNYPSTTPLPQGEGARGRGGFTLIEVLIALTILAIGLLGVALMQVTSISGNTFSREMSVATELGQDMLEKLRTLQYTSTNTDNALLDIAGNHPNAADVAANLAPDVAGNAANIIDERGLWPVFAATFVPPTTAGPRLYTRIWTVTDDTPAANMKAIDVTVSWTEKGAALPRSITITGVKVRS